MISGTNTENQFFPATSPLCLLVYLHKTKTVFYPKSGDKIIIPSVRKNRICLMSRGTDINYLLRIRSVVRRSKKSFEQYPPSCAILIPTRRQYYHNNPSIPSYHDNSSSTPLNIGVGVTHRRVTHVFCLLPTRWTDELKGCRKMLDANRFQPVSLESIWKASKQASKNMIMMRQV